MAQLKPEFPIEPHHTPDYYKTTHLYFKMTFDVRPDLDYKVLIPVNWVYENDFQNAEPEAGNLVPIGVLAERLSGDAAAMKISVVRFPEVNLIDFVHFISLAYNLRITEIQPRHFAFGQVFDGGGLMGDKNNPWIFRITVGSDGGRIFVVHSQCPASRYPEFKDTFILSHTSFQLLKPTGSPKLEQLLKYKSEHFEFLFPASWQTRRIPVEKPGKKGVEIILPQDDQILGFVRIKSIDKSISGNASDIQTLLDQAYKELLAGQFQGSDLRADPDKILAHPPNSKGTFNAYGTLNGNPIEVLISFIEFERYMFAITMLAVPKAKDPLLWMRTRRVFELARCSVSA